MFSCAWRLTITSPASPPRSSSSLTAGKAWIGPCSVPTASAAQPASTNGRSGPRARHVARRAISQQSQNAAEHRDAGHHDQVRVQRRRLLGLLRRQPVADDEAALVEAEIERRAVERERAAEQEPEAAFGGAPRRRGAAELRRELEERAGDEHRQAGDEVDVRVADRVDPFARVPGAVEPVRVRRLHLDHALHRADRQRRPRRWRGTSTGGPAASARARAATGRSVSTTFAAKHQ